MACKVCLLAKSSNHILIARTLTNVYRLYSRSLSTSVAHSGRYRNNQISSKHVPQTRNIKNPGLERRLNIIKQDTPDVESAELDVDDIEELEGDFLNAREMNEYHLRLFFFFETNFNDFSYILSNILIFK